MPRLSRSLLDSLALPSADDIARIVRSGGTLRVALDGEVLVHRVSPPRIRRRTPIVRRATKAEAP